MKLHGKRIAIWNGEFVRDVARCYRISLCTTCMGRLYDLQQTLPKNIEDNRDYPNIEFVVLDYNSDDGLEKWMKDQMTEHIETGRVAYFRTTEPQHYSMSHSRNMAFLLASGEIVNNVDADNWVNPGFAAYLNRLANECPRRAVFAKGRRLLRGRIGFYKDEWLELGGYDEQLSGYGHDDKDLFYRALMKGFSLMWFGGEYVRRLKTSQAMKVERMENKNRKETEARNKSISDEHLLAGCLRANDGVCWGEGTVVKNFTEVVHVGRCNP